MQKRTFVVSMMVVFTIIYSAGVVAARSKVYRSSDYLDKDYVQLAIIGNEMIRIEGRSGVGKTGFALVLVGSEGRKIAFRGAVGPDGFYGGEYDVSEVRTKNTNELWISFIQGTERTYWSYYTGIRLDHEAGELWFAQSPVYEHNLEVYSSYSQLRPSEYLEIEVVNREEIRELQALADEITAGENTDYGKLLAIHDWVAQNIYYNYDGYRSGDYGSIDPHSTLQRRVSICHGYSWLTEVLLRSIGIPARLVSGLVLGPRAQGRYWDETPDADIEMHSWNEAFVDGRWVILDVTWDGRNRFEDGQFKQGEIRYRYFDPSLEAFSHTHKMMPLDGF